MSLERQRGCEYASTCPWMRAGRSGAEARIVCTAADQIGQAPPDEVRAAIDRAYDFLANRFIPSARGEDELRARVALRDRTRYERDRVVEEIQALTARLARTRSRGDASDDAAVTRDLRRILYEASGLLGVHPGARATTGRWS